MFAIVDVETTGGYADNHRVIEVGIAISDGKTITERYNQLINPQRYIPKHITELTGISNDDVSNAPSFEEVAQEVFDLIQGQVFVAHNVNFDYTFIRRELERSGYTWSAKKLCTVRLSRSIFPGFRSYKLSSLAREFDVVNPNPHRALADAETAADIFHRLLEKDENTVLRTIDPSRGQSTLPMNLPREVFHQLPEQPGVYYMENESGEILYIGKAINIKKRIAQHFATNPSSKRAQRWYREIYHIRYTLTGSEWLALFHEDREIRQHWPPYNSAQKHPVAKWGVVEYLDRNGWNRLAVQRAEKRVDVLVHFFSYQSAFQFLAEQVKEKGLNPAYSGMGWEEDIPMETHNQRVKLWKAELSTRSGSALALLPGPDSHTEGFIAVANGEYYGMGVKPKGDTDWQAHLWHRHTSPTASHLLRALQDDAAVPWIEIHIDSVDEPGGLRLF